MKLWSRGLGRRELVMDFTHYAVRRSEDGGIEIFGVTEQPVSWEFRVHIGEEDIPGIVNVALSRPVIRMVATNILTAVATVWRRRRFKVPEGLEERVKTAHSHVMDRTRPNRPIGSRDRVTGTGPPAGRSRTEATVNGAGTASVGAPTGGENPSSTVDTVDTVDTAGAVDAASGTTAGVSVVAAGNGALTKGITGITGISKGNSIPQNRAGTL
ncbi:MAG: hypothetical protein ACYDGY_08865 [Acidimicrobiales bacterium]